MAEFTTPVVLFGWSLGGTIAMQCAYHFPEKVAAVITCCSSPCFVNQGDWSSGVSEESFQKFSDNLQHDANSTLKKFWLLACHGRQTKTVFNRIAPYLSNEHLDVEHLLAALNWLSIDYRPFWQTINIPVLHLLAEHDSLLNARAITEYYQESNAHCCDIVSNASHALAITHDHYVRAAIDRWLNTKARPCRSIC